jgi:hypothetical protein
MSKAADLQQLRNLAVELGPNNVGSMPSRLGHSRDFAKPLWEDEPPGQSDKGSWARWRTHEIAGPRSPARRAGEYITGQTIVIDGGAVSKSAK